MRSPDAGFAAKRPVARPTVASARATDARAGSSLTCRGSVPVAAALFPLTMKEKQCPA